MLSIKMCPISKVFEVKKCDVSKTSSDTKFTKM